MRNALAEKTLRIIMDNPYITLATCFAGQPWIAPLYYAVDRQLNLYFMSPKESLHCKQMLHNKNVAVAIYDSSMPPESVDGVQISGVGEQVPENELPGVLDMFTQANFDGSAHPYTVSDFNGEQRRRFFRIRPTEVFTMDMHSSSGDERVSVNIQELQSILAQSPACPSYPPQVPAAAR